MNNEEEDNVIPFDGYTRLDIEADNVLEGAKGVLKTCFLIGEDKEGELYIASNTGKIAKLSWLLTLAQSRLIDIYEDGN